MLLLIQKYKLLSYLYLLPPLRWFVIQAGWLACRLAVCSGCDVNACSFFRLVFEVDGNLYVVIIPNVISSQAYLSLFVFDKNDII